MNEIAIASHKVLVAIVAVSGVVTANLLARNVEPSPLSEEAVSMPIPSAPAPIEGIAAPVIEVLPELGAPELTVPVLRRPAVLPPPPPGLERNLLLGRGVLPAPAAAIHPRPPEVDAARSKTDARLEVPELVRPELSPTPIR